jgi:hypothetical protein
MTMTDRFLAITADDFATIDDDDFVNSNKLLHRDEKTFWSALMQHNLSTNSAKL